MGLDMYLTKIKKMEGLSLDKIFENCDFENVYDFVTNYPWLFRNSHSYEQK